MLNAGAKPYVSVKLQPGELPLPTLKEVLGMLGSKEKSPAAPGFPARKAERKRNGQPPESSV